MKATDFIELLKQRDSENERQKSAELELRKRGYDTRVCSVCNGTRLVPVWITVYKCAACDGDGVEWYKKETN